MEVKEIPQLDERIQQLDEKMKELDETMKELREKREKLLELRRKFQSDHKPCVEQEVTELTGLENLNVPETYISSMNKEADAGLDGIAGKEEEKKKKKKKKKRNKKKKPSVEEESDCMAGIGSCHGDFIEVESNCNLNAFSEQEKEETSIKKTNKVVQELLGGVASGGVENKLVKQESGHEKVQEALTNLNLNTLAVDEPILKFAIGSGSCCTINKRRTKKNFVKPRIAHTRDKNIPPQSDDASTFVGVEATKDSNEGMENKLKTELTQILKIGLTKMLAVSSNVQGDGKITTGTRAYNAYQEKKKKK